MKKTIVLLICASSVFASGCTWYRNAVIGVNNLPIECRHTALVAAVVAEDNGLPYEIWVGTLAGQPHAVTAIEFDEPIGWAIAEINEGAVTWAKPPGPGEATFFPDRQITLSEAQDRWLP